MNLRTFVPPPATPAAPAPGPGDAAPRLPPPGLPAGRPAVIGFLRHTGCPFAEATITAMRAAAAASPEIGWVAVSHAPAEATARWSRAVGGPGAVHLLVDPERHAYAAWGLGRSSLGHFMGRRSLVAVARTARAGTRNRHPEGTRWQQAGTFAVDAGGVVRWRHLPEHAGALPDLTAAVAALASRQPAACRARR